MTQSESHPEPATLEDVLLDVWRTLSQALGDRDDPNRTPVLATSDAKGSHARTVVLREVRKQDRALLCYTDGRSAKATQIRTNPRVNWLFYDPLVRRQIRAEGRAELHQNDDLVDEHWRAASSANRKLYAGPPPGGEPDASGSENPRANFAVLRCIVDRIDWLDQSVPGHRRAQFDWSDGEWLARWVAP